MNVLLDLDGTLTDPFEGISRSIAHALEVLDVPCPPRESLRWCIGPPIAESFAALLETDDAARVARAVAVYRERFGEQGLYENAVIPGIPEALEALAGAGWTLFVATSKAHVYARRIVEHFGLAGHFRAVHGSELDGTRAAKPDLLAHLLETEAVRAAEAVMVGDRHHDVRGGLANALGTVGVLWGYGSREELTGAGAHALCDAPGGLLDAVRTAAREERQ